jgi:putative glycosyltransferase
VTVRLMKREYVNSLLLHRERQTVIGGLWVITGYRQRGLPVDKRASPRTTYSFWHRWHALIDSITAFSETPLVAIFYLGLAISGLSGVIGAWLFIRRFFFGNILAGWISVMLSVWFLGGVLIFCVGIIGIYISKIFIETKNRPYTIVRKVHAHSTADLHQRSREQTPGDSPSETMRPRRAFRDGQRASAEVPLKLKRAPDERSSD